LNLEPLHALSARQGFHAERREQSADSRELLHVTIYFLWRRWKFVLTVTALALVAAQVWLTLQTPLYSASTQIVFDPLNENLPSSDSGSQRTIDSLAIENQIAIVKSTALLRRVVENERLVDDPEFSGRSTQNSSGLVAANASFERAAQFFHPYLAHLANGEANAALRSALRAIEAYAGVETGSPTDEDKAEAARVETPERGGSEKVEASVAALARAVTAKRVGEADVISVSVASQDPARAARLANAVAEAYLVDPLYARLDAGVRESTWLNEKLPALRDRLRESEEAVVAFRAAHNLIDGGRSVSLDQDQMAALNARLVAVRADVAEKKAKVDLLQGLESEGRDAQGLPEAMNSPLLASLRNQLGENSLRLAGLAARLGDSNPEVVKARAERADTKRAIAAELQAVAENVRSQYALALAQQRSIENILHDAAGETNVTNKTAIELHELEEAASVNRTLFEDFLKRASIIHELSGDQARLGRIIVPASPPEVPTFPRKMLVMSLALVAGLGLGLAGAWAREQLNRGFITSREAEEQLGVPLLASIGRNRAREAQVALPGHILLNPLSRLSEAVRTLRVSIQMAELEGSPKVVQVTSALPGEGKTTTSLMLATSFSESGLKTLIVDADLRNPSVTRHFGFQRKVGLVDVLLDQIDAESALCFSDAQGLWVLPAGGNSQRSGDLLTFGRLHKLIGRYRSIFDCIVLDTPPVGQVVDARILSKVVDKTIFVVKWRTTDREMVRENIKRLPDPGKIAGVVFNFVDERLAKRYGDSRYFNA
jgi:succinoglycan biosynthesis transport protein ExoP